MQYLVSTLSIINIFSFLLVGYDKSKARRHGWRVAEKHFFLAALLGGAAGVLLGMYVFRHKTKHHTFTFGIPLLLVINVLALYYMLAT